MAMKYHVAFSCDGVLREPPDVAGKMLRESATGRTLESHEVYALAVIYKAMGYDVIPPCASHDAKGNCLGHETTNG